MPLELHAPAPDFTLPSTAGGLFTLSQQQAGRPCVLYFYPKDFTNVCTAEACSFRDQFSAFRDMEIAVYGISRDTVETHLAFQKTHRLPFDLLADVDGAVARLYKAQVPVVGLTRRITYLLDATPRIAAVYADMFSAEGHIRAMIEKVKG